MTTMKTDNWTRKSLDIIKWGADTLYTHKVKDLEIGIGTWNNSTKVNILKNGDTIKSKDFTTRKEALIFTKQYRRSH